MSVLRVLAMGALTAASLSACNFSSDSGTGTEPDGLAVAPAISEGDVLLVAGSAEPETRNETLTLVTGPASWTMTGAFEMGANSSSGRTSGYFFRMPAEFEQRASGHTVTIEVAARSTADGSFALAYSTNEVGNSGWYDIPVTGEYSVHSVEYAVRTLENGAGDFVGIAPDPLGTGQSVEIAWIKLSIE